MTNLLKLLSVLAIVGTLILVPLVSYISAANYGNRTERQIEAVWGNGKNILGQYTLKVQETASVPAMYKEDFKEVIVGAVEGRYGAGGSKAIFQFIQEAQIPFDSRLYQQIQQVIESGRNDFTREQTKLIDVKRGYETNLGYVWKGFWLKQAGYPKIKLEDFKPVVAADTEEAFKTGVQAPIKLR